MPPIQVILTHRGQDGRHLHPPRGQPHLRERTLPLGRGDATSMLNKIRADAEGETMTTRPPTFGLSSSRDFLEELRETISDLKNNPVNPRLARYAAIVAWSMCDWVAKELKEPVQHDQIKEQCPALGYLQELANIVKHRELRPSNSPILNAADRTGAFSCGFSRDFDIVRLELTLEDGTTLWFEEIIQQALEFWEQYFEDKGLGQGESEIS